MHRCRYYGGLLEKCDLGLYVVLQQILRFKCFGNCVGACRL